MIAEPTRRSLGPKELALLEAWEADRVRIITLDDLQRALGEGTKREAARKMASRLRRKGFLSPVGRGIYAVLPLSSLGVEAPDIAAHLATLRVRGIEFYVGFDTAAGHYGWYPEAYGRVTIAVASGTRRAIPATEATYVRVVQTSKQVFTDGVTDEAWRGVRVPMSSREQTILDIIRRVDLVDGFSGCLAVLKAAGDDAKFGHTKLAGLAARRSSVRLRKRLGWLCERAGWTWSETELELLRKDWQASHRATLAGSHGGEAPGLWDNRWKILINVPERELAPATGVQ